MKKDEKGSLVIEASLTFVIFVLVLAALISLINITWVHMRVQSALTSTVSELSCYTYIYSKTKLKSTHDDAKNSWEEQKKDVDALINGVNTFVDDVDKIGSGDIDWDSINSAADNAEALSQMTAQMVENPVAALKSFMAMGKSALLDKSKSIFLGEISRVLMKKYLEFNAQAVDGENINADAYLKSMGVQNGIQGLNFENHTKLFSDADNKIIDVVVTYKYKVPFSPFPLEATMINRATTVALMDGDGTKYED